MVRHFSWTVGVAVLLMATPVFADCQQDKDKRPSSPSSQQSPRPKFWRSRSCVRRLESPTRSRPLSRQIFSTSIGGLRDARKELDALEAVLSRTIQENTADVFIVTQQVDKVEAARSAYNKARTVMLYRMNLLLTPEQRTKVKAMNDRYEDQRRRDDEARRKQGKSDHR